VPRVVHPAFVIAMRRMRGSLRGASVGGATAAIWAVTRSYNVSTTTFPGAVQTIRLPRV